MELLLKGRLKNDVADVAASNFYRAESGVRYDFVRHFRTSKDVQGEEIATAQRVIVV